MLSEFAMNNFFNHSEISKWHNFPEMNRQTICLGNPVLSYCGISEGMKWNEIKVKLRLLPFSLVCIQCVFCFQFCNLPPLSKYCHTLQ